MIRHLTALPSRLLLAAIAGFGVAAGFAPVEWPILVWVGLAVLIAVLREQDARRGALLGAVFGVTFLGFLVWWVHVLGIGVLFALVAVELPFYALFGLAFAVVSHRAAWPIYGAVLWMAMEYLRSVVPFGGFPWGRLAFTTVGTPLDSYARWVGVSALSGLVFLVAALTVQVLVQRSARSAVLCGLAIAAVFAVGALLPTGLASPGPALRIAIVQGNVPGTGANGMGEQRQVLENHISETLRLAAKIDSGAVRRPDIVLWPENASDIDPLVDGTAGDAITGAARAVGAPILVGAILDGPTDGTARNVGIAWDPETGPGQRYVKRHLVPYGEYVPMRGLAEAVVPLIKTEIPRDMLAGNKPGVVRIGSTTVGDMMCFDVVFDNLARDVVDNGAGVLVVQTNNATYLGTSQPAQQWQIARVRAIETGRYVAVPSTDGVSGVIGPRGQVLDRAPVAEPASLSTQIRTATGITTGVRVGRWVEWAAVVAALVIVVVGRRKAHRL